MSDTFTLTGQVDLTEATSQVDSWVKSNSDTELVVRAVVDGADNVDALASTVGDLDGSSAEVAVAVDDEATDVVTGITDTVGELDGATAEVAVEADDQASGDLEDVKGLADDIDGTDAEVSVTADTGDAESNLDGLREASDGLIESLSELSPALGGMAKLLTAGGGAALGIAGVGAALGAAAVSAYEFTQQVEQLSLFTGSTTEESSKLLAVLQDFTHIKLTGLENVLGRVQDKFLAMPGLAAQIGVNLDNARGPLDLFVQTVDALNSGQLSAAERIDLGMQVFGKRGLTVVNSIAAEISGPLADAMGEVSDERIISDEDIARADKMEEALGNLKGAFASVAQDIGEPLITLLTPLLELVGKATSLIPGMFEPLNALISGEQLGLGTLTPQMLDFVQIMGTGVDQAKAWNLAFGSMDGFDAYQASVDNANRMVADGVPLQEVMAEVFGQSGQAALSLAVALGIVSDATADIDTEPAVSGLELINQTLKDLQGPAERFPLMWADIVADLQDGGDVSELTAQRLELLANVTGKSVEELTRLAATSTDTGAALTEAAHSIDELNRAAAASAQVAKATDQNWGILLNDLADGTVDTQAAADAYNILQTALMLTDEQMQALVDQKLDQKLKDDAAAADEATKAWQEHAKAIHDAAASIAEVTSAAPDISGALDTEFGQVDDLLAGLKFDVDFQPAMAKALDGLRGFGPDLETLAAQWGDVVSGKDITIFGNVRADDAEFMQKVQPLIDLFQQGTVNAFEQGGTDAANTFVQSTAAQIAASTGLDISEVYRIMGLPPDGTITTLIAPEIEKQHAEQAASILDTLAGVSEDPRIAAIQVALDSSQVDPDLAYVESLVLAKKLGIPVSLAGIPQADIDAAEAALAANPVAIPTTLTPPAVSGSLWASLWPGAPPAVEVPVTPTIPDAGAVLDQLDEITAPREADINVKADNAGAVDRILDTLADERDASIFARGANIFATDASLDTLASERDASIFARGANIFATDASLDRVAADRTADITAVAHTARAELDLDRTARNRTATITINTVGGGSSGGGGASAVPGSVGAVATSFGAAPTTVAVSGGRGRSRSAPAPVVHNHIAISAAVIGSRFAVQREVRRALRGSVRLNGRGRGVAA